MTTASAFIPEEWEILSAGILQPAMAVSLAERGGTLTEMLALYDTLAGELKAHSSNPLIAALLDHVVSRKAADALKAYDDIAFETLRDMALRTLASAEMLLRKKATPEELAVYREIVRVVCHQVAGAHGEGSGSHGEKVSASERDMLNKIEAILSSS
ncbi:MAG: hypothetical protein IAE89_02165 [Anaerolineae bacterium]|nr:hypothetical protein [Anaerolineae bacterium]